MKGTYKEELNFLPGEIVVTNNNFEISFYFKGIDNRYNGRFFKIQSCDIQKYIIAFNDNWTKYEDLKKLNTPGQLSVTCEMDMRIFIGDSFFNGLSLNQYDVLLKTRKEVDAAIDDLTAAYKRGSELIVILSCI